MDTEETVQLHFLTDGDTDQFRCIYNRCGYVALISPSDRLVTMSPSDACKLAKMLKVAAEEALSDLQDAIRAV